LKAKASKPSPVVKARRAAGVAEFSGHSLDNLAGEIMSRRWRILLSFCSGVLLALAFPNLNLPLLAWVAIAPLIVASLDGGLGEAALRGLLFGSAFFLFSTPWIYTVMRQYGPLPPWEAAGVMALMILAASPYFVAFTLLMAWIARRGKGLAVCASPFLWTALELGRARMPDIAFPWNLTGYAASGNLALVQLTSVTGIYGLSLIVAAYNAIVVWLIGCAMGWLKRPRGPAFSHLPGGALAVLTALILGVALIGPRFVPAAQASRVAHLVQPDLPQSMEYPANWGVIHAGDMAELDRLSIAAGQKDGGLVVWPEVPAPFSLTDPEFARRAQAIARDSGSDFLLGVIGWAPGESGRLAPYNSAAMLDPAGRVEFQYDKIHLVPFSEYVPWRDFFWFAKNLTGLAGDFRSGRRYAVGELPAGRFSTFICYEAVFPGEVRQFVLNGAGLLINLSNDGWFGRSSAPAQSLQMARVRAVEERRWLLRDTNNGYTVSVDPYGRIVARMGVDVRGELDAPYAFRSDESMYTRWGDWLPELCAAIGLILLLVAALRRRPFGPISDRVGPVASRAGGARPARTRPARSS
jgi:apolipoprotein N-acyltransferase